MCFHTIKGFNLSRALYSSEHSPADLCYSKKERVFWECVFLGAL